MAAAPTAFAAAHLGARCFCPSGRFQWDAATEYGRDSGLRALDDLTLNRPASTDCIGDEKLASRAQMIRRAVRLTG